MPDHNRENVEASHHLRKLVSSTCYEYSVERRLLPVPHCDISPRGRYRPIFRILALSEREKALFASAGWAGYSLRVSRHRLFCQWLESLLGEIRENLRTRTERGEDLMAVLTDRWIALSSLVRIRANALLYVAGLDRRLEIETGLEALIGSIRMPPAFSESAPTATPG